MFRLFADAIVAFGFRTNHQVWQMMQPNIGTVHRIRLRPGSIQHNQMIREFGGIHFVQISSVRTWVKEGGAGRDNRVNFQLVYTMRDANIYVLQT